jgi:hypothetical protein
MTFLCPKVICSGDMKKHGTKYVCRVCGLEVANQEDWWNQAEQFQKEACIKVLNQHNHTKKKRVQKNIPSVIAA